MASFGFHDNLGRVLRLTLALLLAVTAAAMAGNMRPAAAASPWTGYAVPEPVSGGIFCLDATHCLVGAGNKIYIFIDNGVPTWSLGVDFAAPLSTISCNRAPAIACVAAGNHGTVVATSHIGITPWVTAPVPGDWNLTGSSCTATTCYVVGSGDATHLNHLLSYDVATGQWTAGQFPANTPADTIHGISCTSVPPTGTFVATEWCMAVGGVTPQGVGLSSRRPVGASVFDVQNVWTLSVLTKGTLPQPTDLSRVSCPDMTYCRAVGAAVSAAWNGSAWTIDYPASHPVLTDVDCYGRYLWCGAAVGGAQALTDVGPGWVLQPGAPSAGAGLTGASCPVRGTCYFVGGSSLVKYGVPTTPPPPPPDTTPPVVTVPGPITANGTDPRGALVTYIVSATDDRGVVSSLSCDHASGSWFPFGKTPVACRATDPAGNIGYAGFTVTVRDVTPPTLVAPAAMTVNATTPAGAVVNYTATATDDYGVPTITCTPVSGSTFAVGPTTVSCKAVDSAGNQANATFLVTVLGPTEQLTSAKTELAGYGLPAWQTSAISGILELAQRAIQAGRPAVACRVLLGYSQAVQALGTYVFTPAQMVEQMAGATSTRSALGC